MESCDCLAGHHRRVVDQVASGMSELERNVLGFALRSDVEARLVPGLLKVDALLLGIIGNPLRGLWA